MSSAVVLEVDFVHRRPGGVDRSAVAVGLVEEEQWRRIFEAPELNAPDGPRPVPGGYAFRPGDQFRLRLRVDFTAEVRSPLDGSSRKSSERRTTVPPSVPAG